MVRLILTAVLPFLAPVLVFLAWVWLRGRYVSRHGGQAPVIETSTWFWLVVTGLALAASVLVITAVLEPGGVPGQEYRPPVLIDGRVVPGGFAPDPRGETPR